MSSGPPVAAPRRSIVQIAIGVAAALVVVVVVTVIVHATSSGTKKQVAQMEAVLDHAPLPPAAQLVGQQENEAHGDLAAYVERQYRLRTATGSSAAIRVALTTAGYRVVDLQTGSVTGIAASDWPKFAGAASGDVNVLPPDRSGGGIEYSWKGDSLYLSLRGGGLD